MRDKLLQVLRTAGKPAELLTRAPSALQLDHHHLVQLHLGNDHSRRSAADLKLEPLER